MKKCDELLLSNLNNNLISGGNAAYTLEVYVERRDKAPPMGRNMILESYG